MGSVPGWGTPPREVPFEIGFTNRISYEKNLDNDGPVFQKTIIYYSCSPSQDRYEKGKSLSADVGHY